MQDVIGQLQQLGFSQYEAQAYLALLKENPANGYELAKRSGIPRPNIYPVLQKLEDRGAILRLTAPDGIRYTPLPIQDLISQLRHHYQEVIEAASQALKEESVSPQQEFTLNFHGYPLLLDHARRMLEAARSQLLLIVWPEEARHLAVPLRQARERGVHLVTLCLNGCPHTCPYCQGDIFRYSLATPERGRWIVLVVDQAEMLAGEISPSAEAMAVTTRQKMLVSLASGYIHNTIALARIIAGLGDRFEELLDPKIHTDLDRLQDPDRWFDTMRQLIHTQENSN